jgi:hypothetical protein
VSIPNTTRPTVEAFAASPIENSFGTPFAHAQSGPRPLGLSRSWKTAYCSEWLIKQPGGSLEPMATEGAGLSGAMRTLADIWQRDSQAFFENQEKWFRGLAKATLPYEEGELRPKIAAFKAAQEPYPQCSATCMSLSSKLSSTFGEVQGETVEAQTFFFAILDPQAGEIQTAQIAMSPSPITITILTAGST